MKKIFENYELFWLSSIVTIKLVLVILGFYYVGIMGWVWLGILSYFLLIVFAAKKEFENFEGESMKEIIRQIFLAIVIVVLLSGIFAMIWIGSDLEPDTFMSGVAQNLISDVSAGVLLSLVLALIINQLFEREKNKKEKRFMLLVLWREVARNHEAIVGINKNIKEYREKFDFAVGGSPVDVKMSIFKTHYWTFYLGSAQLGWLSDMMDIFEGIGQLYTIMEAIDKTQITMKNAEVGKDYFDMYRDSTFQLENSEKYMAGYNEILGLLEDGGLIDKDWREKGMLPIE